MNNDLTGSWSNYLCVSHFVFAPNPATTDKSGKASASAVAALKDFAASVGFKEDHTKSRSSIFNGVTLDGDGEIVKINWSKKALNGTLPDSDINMPRLMSMDLSNNTKLTGTVQEHSEKCNGGCLDVTRVCVFVSV